MSNTKIMRGLIDLFNEQTAPINESLEFPRFEVNAVEQCRALGKAIAPLVVEPAIDYYTDMLMDGERHPSSPTEALASFVAAWAENIDEEDSGVSVFGEGAENDRTRAVTAGANQWAQDNFDTLHAYATKVLEYKRSRKIAEKPGMRDI